MAEFKQLPFQYQERARDLTQAPDPETESRFIESRDQALENFLSDMIQNMTYARETRHSAASPKTDSSFDSELTDWDTTETTFDTRSQALLGERYPEITDQFGDLVLPRGLYVVTASMYGTVDATTGGAISLDVPTFPRIEYSSPDIGHHRFSTSQTKIINVGTSLRLSSVVTNTFTPTDTDFNVRFTVLIIAPEPGASVA